MPPTEESQYTIFIKPRLDSIDDNIAKLYTAIEGSEDKPGMKGRLLLVEAEQGAIRARWKWIFRISAGVVVATILSVGTLIVQHFTGGH